MLKPKIAFLFVALTISSLGLAQAPTAQVTGAVTDPSGAGIPNVKIIVTNVDTNVVRESVSNSEGYYTVPFLPPGNYRIQVRKDGFRSVTRSRLVLAIDQNARIDLTLELGSVSDSVEVVAATPAVERETAAMGTVIDNRRVVDMPLNSRNPYRLTFLLSGVTPGRLFSDSYNNTTAIIINGGRSSQNEIFIDGISSLVTAAGAFSLSPSNPSPDALQEFKVQTNNYSAEYGRSGGGVINMVLKSGTAKFHGTAYEFLRNSKLDANNFFSNRTGTPLPSFKRNQFGGTLGGPIIPNKAFFFFNYEALRQRAASNRVTTLPTAAERSGDFSASSQRVAGACLPVQVFDPFSTRPNPAGGNVRDQFPGNVVPRNRLDAVGQRLVTYYPSPNVLGDPCTGVNNFLSAKADTFNTNQIDAKFDWVATPNNRFVFGLSWRRPDLLPVNHFGTKGDPFGATPSAAFLSGQSAPTRIVRGDYTKVVTPALVLNIRGGLNRQEVYRDPFPSDFSLTELGFPQSLQDQLNRPTAFPGVTVGGFSPMGNGGEAIVSETANTYSLGQSATWIRGKHTVKFGGEQRRLQHSANYNFGLGSFSFNQGFTQGPDPNAPRADRGHSIASMLLGTGTGSITQGAALFTTNHYYGFFLQDDYKLTSKLTLNLGVRWDIETGRADRNDQLSWFDFNARSPLAEQVSSLPNLTGGLRFTSPGVAGFDTDKNNFGPRLGFAYSPKTNLVFRGGYGVFYLPFVGGAFIPSVPGFTSRTEWIGSLDGLRPFQTLANAFQGAITPAPGRTPGLLSDLGTNIAAHDRGNRVGYMQQWNFNIQRQLPGNIAVEAAYVGTKGTKLSDTGWQLNQLPVQFQSLGTALQQLVPNPRFGKIPAGSLAQPTITRGQLLRAYPQFLNVTMTQPASASSIYHAFQLRLQRDFSKGLSFLVSYTASKLIDDSSGAEGHGAPSLPLHQDAFNRRASRAVSAQDITQRLVVSHIYELPVGKGKALGGNMPSWLNVALGNWQLNGILTLSGGYPLAFSAANNAGIFSAVQRPNLVGNPVLPGDRSTTDQLARWFDPAAFAQPAAFTLGNLARTTDAIRSDGIVNFDFAVFKRFPMQLFGEGQRLEFRAEAFNLTNTPQFGFPGTTLGQAGFGVIGSQVNQPRQVQLGLRFVF
jgi:hypothetical protein